MKNILKRVELLKLNNLDANSSRIYPTEVIQAAIDALYTTTGRFDCITIIGSVNDEKIPKHLQEFIKIEQCSHYVTHLYIEEDVLYADLVIMGTQWGRYLQTLVDANLVYFALEGNYQATNKIVSYYKIKTINARRVQKHGS
ncbi:hypothetical protein M0R04_14955 [Candidatus Dojkabacteria bacterium]|jgi:hypothetical protein|nr:hypothetical protein [Candidatus Dojkabacteria bacterium]